MGKIPFEVECVPLSDEGDILIRVGEFALIIDPERNVRGYFRTGKIIKLRREGEEAEIIGEKGSYRIFNLPPIEEGKYDVEVRGNKVIVKDKVGPLQVLSLREEINFVYQSEERVLIGTRSPYFYILEPPEKFLGVSFPLSTLFSEYVIVGKGRNLEVFTERNRWSRATLGTILNVESGVLIYVITSSGFLETFTLSGNLVEVSEEPGLIDLVPRKTYAIKLYKYGITFGDKTVRGYFKGISEYLDYILAWNGERLLFFDENGKLKKKISVDEEVLFAKGWPKSFIYLSRSGAYLVEKRNIRKLELEDPSAIEVFPGGYCLANLRGEYLYFHEGETLRGKLEEPILKIKKEGDLTHFIGISNIHTFRRGKIVRKASLL